MKKIRAILSRPLLSLLLWCLPLILMTGLLPSCATAPGQATVQPRDLENLALVATSAAFANTAPQARLEFGGKLLTAADQVDALTADTITAAKVYEILSKYFGKVRPEYSVLASVLSDYIPAIAIPEAADNLAAVSRGMRKAASIYAPDAVAEIAATIPDPAAP